MTLALCKRSGWAWCSACNAFITLANLLQKLPDTQPMFGPISVAEPKLFICTAKCFARLIGSTYSFMLYCISECSDIVSTRRNVNLRIAMNRAFDILSKYIWVQNCGYKN